MRIVMIETTILQTREENNGHCSGHHHDLIDDDKEGQASKRNREIFWAWQSFKTWEQKQESVIDCPSSWFSTDCCLLSFFIPFCVTCIFRSTAFLAYFVQKNLLYLSLRPWTSSSTPSLYIIMKPSRSFCMHTHICICIPSFLCPLFSTSRL